MIKQKKVCRGSELLKILVLVIGLQVVAFCVHLPICLAQTPHVELSKRMQKECKRQVRLLQRDGWTVWGNPASLSEAMNDHYRVLEQAGLGATVVEGRGASKNQNVALQKARNNAAVQYAALRESRVESETNTSIVNKEGAEAETQIRVEQHSTSSSEQHIKNMQPTVSLCRTLDDGTFEVRIFFVVKLLEND